MKNKNIVLIILGLIGVVVLIYLFKKSSEANEEIDFTGSAASNAVSTGTNIASSAASSTTSTSSGSTTVDKNKIVRRSSVSSPEAKYVQRSLNRVLVHQGKPTLVVDGIPGSKTIGAMENICGFSAGSYNQVKKKVSNYFIGNGLADPYSSSGSTSSGSVGNDVLSGVSTVNNWYLDTLAYLNGF